VNGNKEDDSKAQVRINIKTIKEYKAIDNDNSILVRLILILLILLTLNKILIQ